MSVKEFVAKSWADHGNDAEGVLARLPQGVGLLEQPGELPGLAGLIGLIVHVAGEHCGQWETGISLLRRLTEHDVFDADAPAGKAVWRSMAVLQHCAGGDAAREDCLLRGRSGPDSEASDRIRVLAIAASALAGQSRTDEAIVAFEEALGLASYGPDADDPAARALAVTGNNLACELEEKAGRTAQEGRLMLQAAQAGRRYWEIAGNWMNVERAEYRLAMTNLQLGDAAAALGHARLCLDVCTANEADAGELFFAHEALARAHHAAGAAEAAATHRAEAAACAARIEDEGFRGYCDGALTKLDALLQAGPA